MLGWEYPPHISGGLGAACQGLVHGLHHHGARVVLVLPRLHGDEDASRAELVACARSGRGPAATVAVASPLRPYVSPGEYARWLGRGTGAGARRPAFTGGYGADLGAEVARYAEAVLRAARGRRFHLIHAHDWMTFPAGLALKALTRRPLVCHVHASEVDRSGPDGDPAIRSIEQAGLDGCDRVVCVSRYTADVVREHYGVDERKLRVVHNGLLREDPAAPRTSRRRARGRRPLVLFLGRVTRQKGPGCFLEAAARVVAVRPRVRFVLGGSGDLLPTIVERAAALGLARHVAFTGFLRRDEVERLYAMADLYVMPSVSEPFGLTSLEAAASGVPVIVSRRSGAAEVLPHALLVEPEDPVELARTILDVLARPALRRRLSAAGRRALPELRWERSAERLLEVFGELVA